MIKYRCTWVLVCLVWASVMQAQFTRTLSPNAIVSLMTVAPGSELYSTFGHSALRVFDPSQNVDRIYNYGTFDFDQPDFYLNFCRGKLLYILDVERYKSFERGNMLEGRGMQEQTLNLSPTQKERLFNLLEDNALAQNRAYKYDFFYDNCATRIRDMVDKALYGQVTYDTAHAGAQRTMRQLLRSYLTEHPWTGFGIDLVLGMPTDKVAGVQHYVFLPDNLHDAFATARLPEGESLIKDEYQIPAHYTPVRNAPTVPMYPVVVMSIVALLGLACMFNTRANRIFDGIFWFVLGVGGLIIAFLWFFTDHQATKNNLNLFWMLPSHLLVFWRKRRENLWESYFMVAGIIAAGLLLAMKWLPQELPLAGIPLMVLVAVKGFWRGR
jgi:hypothetical protein